MSESVVEAAALRWFEDLGYDILHGPEMPLASRPPSASDYAEVILEGRLGSALARLNPNLAESAIDEAARKVMRTETPSLVENNRRFHKLLTDGIDVEYRQPDGSIAGDKVWLFDFNRPERNEWLAVNQFTVIENKRNRRPDLVVFINGLPLAVVRVEESRRRERHDPRGFQPVPDLQEGHPQPLHHE